MIRATLLLAGLSGMSAVIIGAATAHGGAGDEARAWIDTALKYQMWHAVALLGLAALAAVRPGPAVSAAVICFALGTVLFSGSLYALAATGVHGFAMATPVGGLAFIAGWLALIRHALRHH